MSGGWYGRLDKPCFTPPDSVFGPVWTILYLSMAASAWLVWCRAGFSGTKIAMALCSVQLALNLFWSAIFFGLEAPGLALVEILALWPAILLTTLAFSRISRPAGWLRVPYLA